MSGASNTHLGGLGRILRFGLIGLILVPFLFGDRLGLVGSTASITVLASADAQVRSAFPNRNYGGGDRLRTRARTGDNQRTLVRFIVPNVAGKVQSAQLRLYVRDRSDRGGVVRRATGSWNESSVTWNKAPALAPAVVGRIGATGPAGSWVSVPLLLGNLKSGSKVDLAIVGASSNGAWYASRETGKGPRLVLAITPTSTPPPDPTGTAPPPGPGSGGSSSGPSVGILIGKSELAALPTSGAAWANLKSWADGAAGTADIKNQDEDNDIHVLAKGLVYARTGIASYRAGVLANLKAAVGSESGGRTLALGRNLPGYVVAADLIDLGSYDAAFDTNVFRPWLRRLLTENLDGDTLRSTHEQRPNNWGTHAGAARAALARYLGDAAELARTAQVFHGWLGDRSSYAGFKYGDVSWQCDPTKPVGVNPKSCVKSGRVLDGALPDDMRRGGAFQWPPASTGYPWEAMQGATLQALILDRAGYDAFAWNDRAVLRAASFLYDRALWLPSGDDSWQPWLLNHVYNMTWSASSPAHAGKNMAFTDWLYPR
jgi:hypothetical protein